MKTIQKQSKSRKFRIPILESHARDPLIQRIRGVINLSLGPVEVVLGADFSIWNSRDQHFILGEV